MVQNKVTQNAILIPSSVLELERGFEHTEESRMEIEDDSGTTAAVEKRYQSKSCYGNGTSHDSTGNPLANRPTILASIVASNSSSNCSSKFLFPQGTKKAVASSLSGKMLQLENISPQDISGSITETQILPSQSHSTRRTNGAFNFIHQREVKNAGAFPQDPSNTTASSDHRYFRMGVTHDSDAVSDLQDAVTSGEEAEVRRVLSEGGPHLLQVYTRHTRSTPLHLAAVLAHSHLVKPLMSAGCSIDSFDGDGNTPLHTCCANADTQTASLLLSASSETKPGSVKRAINSKNYAGLTCFLQAASSGNASLMTLLARAGCDVNIGDGLSGRTALHHAVAAGNILLVRFLLQTLKVEVNRRDFGGNTALGLVEQHRRQDLALLLIRHGGEVRV